MKSKVRKAFSKESAGKEDKSRKPPRKPPDMMSYSPPKLWKKRKRKKRRFNLPRKTLGTASRTKHLYIPPDPPTEELLNYISSVGDMALLSLM